MLKFVMLVRRCEKGAGYGGDDRYSELLIGCVNVTEECVQYCCVKILVIC